MSGNAALDQQIAQAMIPRYNPTQAIQGMQRQPLQIPQWQGQTPQVVQNPIFGGAIPMDFGLPAGARIPAGYQMPVANRPPPPSTYAPPAAAAPVVSGGDWASTLGWNPNGVYSQGHGGAN